MKIVLLGVFEEKLFLFLIKKIVIMSKTDDAIARFVASSVACAIAESFTLPTDVAKTRLQIQNNAASGARYTGPPGLVVDTGGRVRGQSYHADRVFENRRGSGERDNRAHGDAPAALPDDFQAGLE